MTTHHLKIEQRWFDRIGNHEKSVEIRYDDRDYQTGDKLRLRVDGGQDWHSIERTITHVLRTADGLEDGYVILSLADPRVADQRDTLKRYRERETTLENRIRGLRGAITRMQRGGAQ